MGRDFLYMKIYRLEWCHTYNFVAICGNYFFFHKLKTNKVTNIKVYILERDLPKNSVQIIRFIAKRCIN